MVDIDLGEMFHNFPLPSVSQRCSGIDITTFKTEIDEDKELKSFSGNSKEKHGQTGFVAGWD
jgi:hypothetical protein